VTCQKLHYKVSEWKYCYKECGDGIIVAKCCDEIIVTKNHNGMIITNSRDGIISSNSHHCKFISGCSSVLGMPPPGDATPKLYSKYVVAVSTFNKLLPEAMTDVMKVCLIYTKR